MWVEKLSMAIIEQAAVDYRNSKKTLQKLEAQKNLTKVEQKALFKAKAMIADCTEFFLSDWFVDLAMGRLDGQAMIEALNAQVKNETEVA